MKKSDGWIQQMLHPDYHIFLDTTLKVAQEMAQQYQKPESLEITDFTIPGKDGIPDVEARILRKKELPANAPIIMDVHGGAFVRGTYQTDICRTTYLALHVPAIVVAVNYRLAPEYPYPAALQDCLHAWQWIYSHAAELGGDPERMGLFGTSAGGNLCAAMAFYVRDHGGPRITFNALNVPVLGLGGTDSVAQLWDGIPVLSGSEVAEMGRTYLGAGDGVNPSYYAMPVYAEDCTNLPPTLLALAEYCPLRDEGVAFAQKLMRAHVPVELYIMPRVCHGYDAYSEPEMTKWVWEGIAMSFRREFGKSVK